MGGGTGTGGMIKQRSIAEMEAEIDLLKEENEYLKRDNQTLQDGLVELRLKLVRLRDLANALFPERR